MQELDLYPELTERLARQGETPDSREVSAKMVTSRSWKTALERVIQAEILPRLLLAHATDKPEPARSAAQTVATPDEFVRLLLCRDSNKGLALMEALRGDGLALDAILLEHLAPAARRLGELWESDHCDFVEVSVGLRRLQFILQMLAPTHLDLDMNPGPARRILLLPTPGESHAFGVSMVARFFTTDGWRVEQSTERDYLDALADDWFDVVGFSLSCDRLAENLGTAVGEARAASRNPSIPVLVGGAIFSAQPELAQFVGADAVARDAPHAVILARSLLNRQFAV